MQKILVFIQAYLPGFKSGGPVRTIANQINALSADHAFGVVCADRDLGDRTPYPSIRRGEWNTQGAAEVYYVRPGAAGLLEIISILRDERFEVLYLNSFLSFRFSIFPLFAARLLRPRMGIILGPRGEFSPGALALKARKKKAFLAFARASGAYRRVVWHASSSYEAADIKRVFGRDARVKIAIDIARVGGLPEPSQRVEGALRLVFISRISPKKNLLATISLLRSVSVPVRLDIFGPIEDEGYWGRCLEAMHDLPGNVEAEYKRALLPEEVSPTLARYDAFLFPTLGENFGHVIAEALFAGLPVLVSDQTPWRNLEAAGIGWDLPLDVPSAFAEKIEYLASLDAADYNALKRHIQDWATQNIGGEDAIEANKALFES